MEERGIQLVAGLDTSGVQEGFNQIEREAAQMAQGVARAGNQAERAVAGVGNGAGAAAAKVDAAQRNLIGSIQRTTAAMEAGSRSGAAYFEVLARQRGVDPQVLAPYLTQLRAVEQAQARAAQTLAAQQSAQQQAAVSARELASAQREAAQAQASRDTLLSGLREQIQLYGRSSDEVLRYRAAQAGVSQEAAQLILQLQNVRAAHEQIAEAARAEAKAQRDAAQAQTSRDAFVAGLREQLQVFGRSTEEVLRYRAAQAGAADAAAPLIAQLHSLRTAHEQAAEAARLEAQAQREASQAQATRAAFVSSLREQIALFGRSSDEVLRYRAAQAGASGEASHLILQLQNMRAAHEQNTAAVRAEAQAQREAQQAQAGRNSFLSGLEQQANAIGRTRAQLLELQAAQLGVATQAAPFITRLREAESGLARTGMSAAQTANNLRMVPAQFTDIITSIQGGQAPLTVFLQQGGQLRDMFGSAGGAARALGGYVMGLVNPYTVAAAAAVALGVAYYQGAQEAHAYNQALISSGNAAGTTASQLSDMARSVSKTVGTQGAAAESLAAMVGTGKVAAANLEQFSTIAVKAQRALGQSVADTAGEFADLSRAPVASLEKLNEKYHFLTGSVYEQVKALQAQGRMYDAGQTAQQAYATAFDGVTTKVDANLGTMQRGWRGLADVAKGAWDAMLNVGREDSLDEKLAKVRAQIAKAQKPFDASVGGNAEARSKLKDNLELEASLEKQKASESHIASIQSDQARFNAADLEWAKVKTENLTRAKQLEYDLASTRQKGLDAGRSELEINKELTKVRLKYNDIYNDGIDARIAGLKRQSAVDDVLNRRSVDLIGFDRSAGKITDEQATERTTAAELAAIDKRRAALVSELALIRLKQNSLKDQQEKTGEIAQLDQERISRVTKGTQDLFLLEQKRYRLAIDNTANVIEASMAETVSLKQQTQAQLDYNEQIGLTKKQVGELIALRLREQAARKDEEADIAEGLDLEGKRAAIIRAQAQELRNRAAAAIEGGDKEFRYDQFKQAVDQYSQVFQTGFADMLNHGRDGWKSFTRSLVTTFKTSVADQIYKMFAKPFVVQMVGSFLGMSQQAIASEIAGSNGTSSTPAAGSAGNSIAAAQAASNLYKTINGGFEKIGTSIANGYDTLASQFGPGTIGSTGPSEMGSTLGSYGQVAAGAIAGHYVGGALSNGFGKQSTTNITQAIGTGIGAYMGGTGGAAIGSFIGGAVGGVINRAFGRKEREELSGGVRGTLSSDGMVGTNYSNWIEKGGWFRSDKSGTDLAAIGADITKQFMQGFDAIKSASSGFASSLGLSADALKDYSKTFDITLGKDQEANKKAITDFFTSLGDEIAKKLVPNLDDLTKSGETASAALERLAGEFQATDQMAQLIGKSAKDVFGSVGLESAKAREHLIDLAGGASALGQQAAFFAQNFLTDAQRLKPVQEALDAAMASLGLSSVKTREQFAEVIKGLDLTTAAGAQQFSELMKLEQAFAQVNPAIGTTTDAIQKMKDAAGGLLGDVDNAFSVLQKVVEASTKTLTARIDKEKALSDAIRSTLDGMKATGTELADRAAAQATIKAQLAITKAGGPLPDADAFKKILSAVTQDSSSMFSTREDYLRDLNFTKNDLAQLGDLADSALSVDQKSLNALTDMLDVQQQIVDKLKGIDITGLTIAQALAGFQTAVGSAKANPIVGATSGIAGLYQSLLGRSPDAAGLEYWQEKAAGGLSMDAISKFIAESAEYKKLHIPGFDNGGDHAGGWRIVGETKPEIEFTGPSRIASYDSLMSRLSSPSDNSAALAAAVERLTATVERQQVALDKIATSTGKHADMFESATAGGGAMLVELT